MKLSGGVISIGLTYGEVHKINICGMLGGISNRMISVSECGDWMNS